jgi:SAM-dependent methyltransferase
VPDVPAASSQATAVGQGFVPRARSPGVRQLNVGCGTDIRPASEGWQNMDVSDIPGIDVRHDAFSFPWPFADETFDRVLCRHIAEHIPHDVGRRPYKDGFLLFMEECHRILKPGGELEIVTPHPRSANTIADPTHTRIVHRSNFDSFNPDRGYAFRHYTSARFRLRSARLTARELVLDDRWRMGKSDIPLTHHLLMRLPFLRPVLMRRPSEMTYVLQRA